jgi:hypothetical protein
MRTFVILVATFMTFAATLSASAQQGAKLSCYAEQKKCVTLIQQKINRCNVPKPSRISCPELKTCMVQYLCCLNPSGSPSCRNNNPKEVYNPSADPIRIPPRGLLENTPSFTRQGPAAGGTQSKPSAKIGW